MSCHARIRITFSSKATGKCSRSVSMQSAFLRTPAFRHYDHLNGLRVRRDVYAVRCKRRLFMFCAVDLSSLKQRFPPVERFRRDGGIITPRPHTYFVCTALQQGRDVYQAVDYVGSYLTSPMLDKSAHANTGSHRHTGCLTNRRRWSPGIFFTHFFGTR